MAIFQRFSEDPKDRVTGRTFRSIAMLGEIKGKKVLNIGTLGGWFEDHIIKHGGFEKLVGIDLPGMHIKELQEKYKDYPNVEFVEGSVLELPFEKNSFDIVAMWEVLEHIPNRTELFALMEINRVLRKDGKLLLSTPNADVFAKTLDPFWYFGHRHYKKAELEWLLDESGFFQYSIETSGGWYELLTMIPFYFFKHVFRSEIPGKNYFEQKRKEEFEKE